MANSIKMTIAKNGTRMFYLDGKRISRDKAIEISENADNEMLTNALGANIEFKDAQAILVISTVDPLEGGKDREFGWCFTNVDDAVEAAKKVAALFGDRFIKAYIMGDAEHFDNRIITTVDKAGNVEVSEEIAEINAADVKVNVAQDGKIIEQIKVDVDTAIKIINRLNYRNDTFVYSNTTREDNADIKCRHFDAYKDNGEKDAFAITEYVINGKLEIVRFFNLFRDITVDMKIGNVNYTIGDKGAIVLTDAEEIVEETPTFGDTFHVFEIGKTYFCSNNIAGKALIRTFTVDARTDAILTGTDNFGIIRKYHIDNAVNSEVVSLSEDIDAPKIYARFEYSDAVKAVSTDNYSRFVDEVAAIFGEKKIADKPADTVDTPPDDEPMSDDIDDICKRTSEVDPAEHAINAEGHNAKVASGNYSLDINGEYVQFENHSIVRIDAMRKMNWIYDHTGKNKIFRYGNRRSSAAKVIDMYMNGERAKEQDEYFREFFIPYNKARGTIEVWVILTYADDREHHFRAEFNQGRLADKFIADVKELAGNTPCQTFIKYRNNYVKPVWEDPHKYETVGNLEHARHLYGEETVGDIAPDEYSVTQEAFDAAVKAEEFKALFAEWTAEILSDPRIEAAYRKARERVEVEFTNYGIPLYTYIKKNGERCYEDFVAKSYITKCGLSETDFIVKARAEAKITRDRRTEKIGDDEVYYVGGKWQCTYSAKYHAGFFRGINSGELMYRVDDLTIVSEQDFWATMIERGACSIDNALTVAEELTAELRAVTRKADYMTVITQSGEHIISRFGNVAVIIDGGVIITNGHETFARYATKEQCLDVIERLETAIERGDEEFEFPTAEFADLRAYKTA